MFTEEQKKNHMGKAPVILFVFLLIGFAQSCIEVTNTYNMVAPGTWRGMLDLRDQATLPPHPEHTDPDTKFDFSKTPTGVMPFNFEVDYLNPDSMVIYLINGKEKQEISKYKFEHNIKGETGRLTIYFPIYDTRIVADVEAGVMEGYWHVDYKQNYSIPFKAYLGQQFRFTEIPEPPAADITGRWAMTFSNDTPDEYPAIGEFELEGNRLYGNINTETGDYRFAAGEVAGDDIFLSSFNGLQAYLYEGKIINQDSILGAFYSGNHYRTTWEGIRNPEAKLRSPESLNNATTDQPVAWNARTITGEKIDFTTAPYQGKIKILEIMGSWCPNCHDEARFLKEWKENNPDFPVEIVSLSFERYADSTKSLEVLNEFLKRHAIDWPVVYGGSTQDARQSEHINFIDQLKAYPTMVVFDRNNIVRYIHTGFYGPATTEYEQFKKEFDRRIQNLVQGESSIGIMHAMQ